MISNIWRNAVLVQKFNDQSGNPISVPIGSNLWTRDWAVSGCVYFVLGCHMLGGLEWAPVTQGSISGRTDGRIDWRVVKQDYMTRSLQVVQTAVPSNWQARPDAMYLWNTIRAVTYGSHKMLGPTSAMRLDALLRFLLTHHVARYFIDVFLNRRRNPPHNSEKLLCERSSWEEIILNFECEIESRGRWRRTP